MLSTKGRKISTANHAHPPEGKRINALSMSRGHGIITTQEREGYIGKPDKKKKEKTKKEGCRGRGKSTEKRNVPYTSILSNILWSIRKQLEYSPSVFYMQMLRVPLNVGLAWSGIYLPFLVVAEVTGNRGFSHSLVYIGGLLLAILCATILKSIFDRLMDAKETLHRCHISYELNKKSMGCFYQIYEKKEMLDLGERARQATEMWDGVQPTKDMTRHAWDFVESVLCYVLFGTVISFVSPWLLLLLTLAPAVNWFCVKLYQKWEYKNRSNWMEIDRKLDYIQWKTADFAVAKDIRIYGMATWMEQMYRMLSKEYMAWDKKRIIREYLSHLADLIVILLRDGAAYVILVLMTWEGKITVDQFVLYFAAISSFATWIGNILNKWNQMRHTSLRLCDLREYLEYPDRDGKRRINPDDYKENAPEIRFDHVCFRYDGEERDTLHDICITIKKGEKIALVGLNGAGKTTLVKLLCGLYQPTKGEIYMDGVPVSQICKEDYYKLIAPVFQQVKAAFFSLAETVSCRGEEQTDFARAEECIRQAGLSKKLSSLPKGIHTKLDKQVNQDGTELSGGELQKLMLARALYKDAPVLVLDEPTAALDPIAESEIYKNYKDMTEGKSALFISHRLASTRFCDRILYLKDGQIYEEGTHDSLILAGGEYAELYKLQSCWYQAGEKEETAFAPTELEEV